MRCCRYSTSSATWRFKASAGSVNKNLLPLFAEAQLPDGFNRLWNGAQERLQQLGPDKGIGFNLTIPIGNKYAQSVQARSLMEYRQAELRLEQLYTQIRMQVVNAQFALINDRAQVQASIAARDYQPAERRRRDQEAASGRFHHGQCAAPGAQPGYRRGHLIAANAAYAKDRAGLYQTLATTLQHYGINLSEPLITSVLREMIRIVEPQPLSLGQHPTITSTAVM
jgi:outer membrane protein